MYEADGGTSTDIFLRDPRHSRGRANYTAGVETHKLPHVQLWVVVSYQ